MVRGWVHNVTYRHKWRKWRKSQLRCELSKIVLHPWVGRCTQSA